MKENGYGKMIDQNWVMKRKRKRHLSGHEQLSGKDKVSIPSESPRNNLPSKERLKLDTVTASSGSPGKKKGYDGYYYECVVCDLRGNLLCCDSCPRTYHLQCLSPPLKNTPPGKWHCPNCCDLSGSVRSVRDSESPRPVRKKSAISSKFTSSSMVSQALKLGKKKSSGKGRPDVSIKVPSLLDSSQQNLSYRTRSSNVSLGGADGGTSPCANIQIEKSNLSCGDISDNRESSSADMDLQSHNRILPDDESSERKIDISSSTKSSNHMLTSTQGSTRQKTRKKKQKFKKVLGPNDESLERFDFPCSIGSPEDVITAKHCASKKSRKKKQKVNLLLELNDESLKMDFDLSCKSKSSEVIVNSTMGGLTVEATKKKQKVNQVLEVNDDFSDKKPDIPCSAGSPQELLSSTLGDAIQKTMKSKQKDDKVSEPKNESSDKISDLSCGIGSPQKMQNCKSDSATQKAKKRKRNVNKMLEQNESSKSKSDLPCSGESQRATFNHTPDSATKVSQKRKQKFNKEDDGKRSSALKENSGVKTSEICRSKATSGSPGTNKACRKRSPLGRQVSRSRSKENCGAKPKGYRHKDANLHLEASHSFKELAELGVDVDNTMICEENAHIEVRQVHKILGCRVQISQPLAACVGQPVKSPVSSTDGVSLTNSTSVASDLPNLPIPQNHGGLLLKETVDPKDVAVVTVEGFQDALKQSDCGKCNEIDIKEDHIHTSRGTRANECIEGGDAIPSTRDLNGHGPSSVGIGVQDESFAGDTHCMRTEQVDMKENNNVGIVRLSTRVEELNAEDAVPDIELNAEENKAEELIFGTANATVGDTVNYEFLVKWAGQSHIHNDWVSETQLKLLAKRKLENYKAKYGTAIINICQDEWRNPQRVLAIRSSKDGISEAFVKWYGLTYDECTWERLDEPVMRAASHLITEFQQFERQALEKDSEKDHFVSIKGEQTEISSLLEQPKELKGGSLFIHQLEALNWLRKCWHKSKNVILADEMGLGKTVSACAFISSLYVEFKARLPCLVLVPLSTMPNWLSEFALWAPHLNVVEYHGASKARAAIRQYEWHASDPDCSNKKTASYKFNVLLTTYEMVLHDSSQLRGVPWEVLVVDEGHRLKNSESKLFNALNTFSFQQRVLLTGTPLQNNIGEMYNLLNFLQTASFPSLSSFEEKFNDLTTTEKVEELKKLVSPHMLRRLKKDVMKNIPPKTERMVPVELSSIQAEYYRAMLTKNYQILRNVGKNVAQQSMLNIVMQLRKVCNHPYLIPGTEPDSGSVEFLQDMRIKASAKLTLLHSMLKVLKKEGHRVLIFSQMTKLLDILDDYLNIEFGPKTYERVDGSVSVADRQAAIARFNQDKSRFIFLLSTRSCGLGINLATADTVIIYDSDFNPHADIQAMNRAHRIGQSNRLLVYRLVVRASVEERILQLAKRKLMLDQLFVNKSGSQKEVEDILRWGTEELFSDSASVGNNCTAESSSSKIEATEPEQKHRRRIGGLGDVYKDKCTDGNPRIIWDENAILKLLDRSDLHSGSPEGADGELENDMLGSVKALEWNDEPTEEQGGTEPAPAVQMDVSIQSPEKKEDTEENEWDRLLRLRWEKYQNDEEAALGRGKRLRKAVSYSEAYAINTSETRNESGNVEDVEPEREYTPAGQALKTKFAKLRARQKEHLSRMKRMRESCPIAGELRAESLPPPEIITGANVREQASSITMDDDKKSTQPLDTPEDKSDSMFKPSRALKQGLSYPLDVPFKPLGPLPPDVFLPSQQFRNPSYMNSLATDNRLPVLGLCAPNANQLQAAHRTRQDHSNLPRPKSRAGINLPQFPFCFSGAGASGETGKGKKIAEDTHMEASDVLPSRFRNSILDGCFPFSSCPPTSTLGRAHNPLESSAASFSGLQEQMALAYGQRQMPTFLHAAEDAPNSYSDLFSPLSLGIKVENSVQDAPTMPLLPNFRMPPLDLPKLNSQLKELPPMLSLGQMRPPYSSLPENHKKVLDNIMMRTECGPGSNNHFKKKLKVVAWSEDELDALWVGVRRHGRGNWDAILRDPKLKFSIYRTCDDLSARWEKEEVKIFNEPASIASNSAAVRYNKSSLPGISDGMMTRALQGSKPPGLGTDHCLPPNFKSHLTDMHLGHSDLISGLLPGELSHGFALQNERSNSLQSNFTKDFPSLLSEGPGSSSNFQLERQVLLNSMESRGLGSMSMNSFNLQQQNQDPLGSNKYAKLPNYMDRSLNSLRDCRTNLRNGEYTSSELMHDQMKLNFGLFSHPVAKDDVVSGSSTMNQLPHWLREAINVPPRPAESELPPTVSAIAHSVRLLYGAEKPAIPPFTIPSPPPSQPKDPRKDLKKKKRFLKHKHRTSDTATSTKNFPSHLLGDDSASCSAVQPAPSLPPTAANTSGFPWIQPNLTLPSLGLNPLNSPSPPSYPSHLNKLGTGWSPSPEVLQLVASCVVSRNQEQECPSLPGIAPTTKILESSLTSSNPSESVDGEKSDMKSKEGKGKDIFSPPIVGDNDSCVLLPAETARPTESGDSSKKSSDPCRIDGQAEVEEKSSEKTSSIELIKQTEEVEK